MKHFDVKTGMHLSTVLEMSLRLAQKTNEPVRFVFNETEHTVYPDDDYLSVKGRVETLLGISISAIQAPPIVVRKGLRKPEIIQLLCVLGALGLLGYSIVLLSDIVDLLRPFVMEWPEPIRKSIQKTVYIGFCIWNIVNLRTILETQIKK